MIGEIRNSQQNERTKTIDRHPQFNKSNSMSQVLYGSTELNPSNCSHFVDELQRFKRDFSSFQKKQQQEKRQKIQGALHKKQQEKENFLHTLDSKNYEAESKKAFQNSINLQLFDMGLKRNGMTCGQPVNPINHEYMNSYGGKKFQMSEGEDKLNKMVRMHHIQAKSTCGYNVINGTSNTPVQYLVPQEQQQGMHSRLLNYQEHYRLRVPEA